MLHFYKIQQPLKKGHTTFGTPRLLEPFLVDFEHKSFYLYLQCNYFACQTRKFNQKWSTLLKMRRKLPKFAMEIYNTNMTLPYSSKLHSAPIWPYLVQFGQNSIPKEFLWVENRVKISRLYVTYEGQNSPCIISKLN